MPTQAIPLALIASVYPIGVAALIILLQGSRPKARSRAFLAGAAICMLAIGFALVFVLRGSGLTHSNNSSPRYGLRLAIGVGFLVGAWFLHHRPPKPKTDKPSRLMTAANNPRVLIAFIVGIALYSPSPSYLSALEVVGSSKLPTATLVAWVFIVVALALLTLELPVLLFHLAPDWTTQKLQAMHEWLGVHGRNLLIVVLIVLGIWQFIYGLVGLV
jgi:hypothetical protein